MRVRRSRVRHLWETSDAELRVRTSVRRARMLVRRASGRSWIVVDMRCLQGIEIRKKGREKRRRWIY